MELSRNVIELLAPARDAECARAAIDHGADAIYMGSAQFGARKAAANSVSDIADVVSYAHTYGARVHVTLNTLLFDHEVSAAKELAWELHRAGVDVLIVQDAALLTDGMPPIELHASTQCDNRTAAKVRFWQEVGMRQVVLARELSLKEIADIASQTNVRLEAFIHGALCVSYSGQCYMSLRRGGRSANRGECAQPCRLAYDIAATDGTTLRKGAHALSLKDNNQSANIESLIDAGVSSFKIEGRLKDADYVANVTMHYRRIIDEILSRRTDLRRLSSGSVLAGFEPDPAKSFNRCFTDYFANGRQPDIWQPLTPKSLGEPIGRVEKIGKGSSIEVRTDKKIGNGDGICFVSQNPPRFGGTKVNTSQPSRSGVTLNLQSIKGIKVGDAIYRNADTAFADALAHDKTRRTVAAAFSLSFSDGTLSLAITDEDGVSTLTKREVTSDAARNADASRDQMTRALSKTGQTIYTATAVEIAPSAAERFIAAAEINALRRDATEAHTTARRAHFAPKETPRSETPGTLFPTTQLLANGNVINEQARQFYASHGVESIEWGYERQNSAPRGEKVMTMRHCLMNSLGKCLRKHPECAKLLPLTLTDAEGRRYTAHANCKECVMEIRTH